jgi:hypothetical protein
MEFNVPMPQLKRSQNGILDPEEESQSLIGRYGSHYAVPHVFFSTFLPPSPDVRESKENSNLNERTVVSPPLLRINGIRKNDAIERYPEDFQKFQNIMKNESVITKDKKHRIVSLSSLKNEVFAFGDVRPLLDCFLIVQTHRIPNELWCEHAVSECSNSSCIEHLTWKKSIRE